jgi:hypothetical protein
MHENIVAPNISYECADNAFRLPDFILNAGALPRATNSYSMKAFYRTAMPAPEAHDLTVQL